MHACSSVSRQRAEQTLHSARGDISTARSLRGFHAGAARRHLERLLQLDPADDEARIRLAHVHTLTGDGARAVPLLEDVVSGAVPAGPRTGYLARLLLGGLRQRAGDLDAAAALFEEAIAIMPSGQSAFAGRALVAQLQGDTTAASSVVGRMLMAQPAAGDPWWSYRFGQHWLADPLLDTLRREARQ